MFFVGFEKFSLAYRIVGRFCQRTVEEIFDIGYTKSISQDANLYIFILLI